MKLFGDKIILHLVVTNVAIFNRDHLRTLEAPDK